MRSDRSARLFSAKTRFKLTSANISSNCICNSCNSYLSLTYCICDLRGRLAPAGARFCIESYAVCNGSIWTALWGWPEVGAAVHICALL